VIENTSTFPLNKDYNIGLDEFNSNTPCNKQKEISIKYSFLEIAKIFFNLTLLRKGERPTQYEKNFIKEVMREEARKEIDHYKRKDKLVRERAQTFFESRRKSSVRRKSTRNSQGYVLPDQFKETSVKPFRNRFASLNYNC